MSDKDIKLVTDLNLNNNKIKNAEIDAISNTITNLTKSDVGLANVDNVSDLNKPISIATQTALNTKQNTLTTVQLNAVNSGITNLKVSTYDGYATSKQDKLSTTQMNALNSGITNLKVSTYDSYAEGKQNKLTETQMSSVDSGITSEKVSTYNSHINNTDIHVTTVDKSTWSSKQNALTTAQLNAVNSGINSTKVNKYDEYEEQISGKVNSSEIKTVAKTGNYNDLTNKPTIPTVNNSKITIKQGEETKGEFTLNQTNDSTITLDVGGSSGGNVDDVKVNGTSVVDADKVANISVPTVNNNTITIQKNNVDIDSFTLNQNTNKSINIEVPAVVDNVTTTDTDKSLSANMGKELQDQINNLKARGRFLSLWDCTTGLATTIPTINPYEYKTGDYFIVSNVGTTNYRPDGTTYDKDVPSTTLETNSVAEADTYYFDGSSWVLQKNTGAEVSFANITGQPNDNSNLEAVLLTKEAVSNKTNDHTATGTSTYPSSYALYKAISTVKPNEVTNSGSSLPSTEGYALNDTFLNTSDKKLYTVINDNYVLQNYTISESSWVLPDFDSTNAIVSGFMPRLMSYGSTTQIGKYLLASSSYALRKLWYDVLTIRFHFQLSELKSDGNYYNIYYFGNYYQANNESWTLQLKDGELFWTKLNYGSGTVTGAIKLTDYKFDSVTKHYYVEINKIDSTYANTKISNVGYDQELVADDTVECPDYANTWSFNQSFEIGYISYYQGVPAGTVSPIKLYLLDSYGGDYFVAASGTNSWDQGYTLTNLSQYADITNGIMYSYINNELYTNVAEFDKIQGSPYDNSELSDALDSKADSDDIKNSTITINQGGQFKGAFTLNQSDNATINLDTAEGGSYPINETVITETDFQEYKVAYKGDPDNEYLDLMSLIDDKEINGNINLNNYRCFIDGADLTNKYLYIKNGDVLFDSMEGGCGRAFILNDSNMVFDDVDINAPQLESDNMGAIELKENSNLTFRNCHIEAMFNDSKAFIKVIEDNTRITFENITTNIICNEDLSGEQANISFGLVLVSADDCNVSIKNCNNIRIANDNADEDADISNYMIKTASDKTVSVDCFGSTIWMHGKGNGDVFNVNLDNEEMQISNNDLQGQLTARFETSETTISQKLENYPVTFNADEEYWDIGEYEDETYAIRCRITETFTANDFDEYLEAMRSGKLEIIRKFINSFNNNSFRNVNGYGYLFTSNSDTISAKEIMFEDGGFKVSGLEEVKDGQALVYDNGAFKPQNISGGSGDGYFHPENYTEFNSIIEEHDNAKISFDNFDYSTIPSDGFSITDKDWYEIKDLNLDSNNEDFTFDLLNNRLFYISETNVEFVNLNINLNYDKEITGYNPIIEFGGNDNYKDLTIRNSNININNLKYTDTNYTFRVFYVDSKIFTMENSSVNINANYTEDGENKNGTKGNFLVMHGNDYMYFDSGLFAVNIKNSTINIFDFEEQSYAIKFEGSGVHNADSVLRCNINNSMINTGCSDENGSWAGLYLLNNATDVQINYSKIDQVKFEKLNDWDFQDWEEGHLYYESDKIKWIAPWDENFKKYLLVKNNFVAGDANSIWQEYENGNIEDYYNVRIQGTLFSGYDSENLVKFNNDANIFTDSVNTNSLSVNNENWDLPISDDNLNARDAASAIKELANGPKEVTLEGDNVTVDIVGNADIICKDKITALTINGSGGLKEIYSSGTLKDMAYNDGKYWLANNSDYIKYSTDLTNWINVYIRQDAYTWKMFFGNNIIVVCCNDGYACINKNDYSQVKFYEKEGYKPEYFDSVECKDGYIYVHSCDSSSLGSYGGVIIRFKDDYSDFTYEDKTTVEFRGFRVINNAFYVATENNIYKTNNIWDIDNWENIYEKTQTSMVFAPIQKGNTLYVFVGTWYDGYKWITTTDDFETTTETSVGNEFEVDTDKHYEIVKGEYLYCLGYWRKLYQVNLTTFEVNIIIADDGNKINEIPDGVMYIKEYNYVASYTEPKALPTTETNVYFSTDEETPTLTDNANLKWLNSNSIEADSEYALSIKRGYAVLGKVQQ